MTKEEILNKNVPTITFGKLIGTPKEQVFMAMDEWAKYHASLAFDAGMELAEKWATGEPADALEKEEYLKKNFK